MWEDDIISSLSSWTSSPLHLSPGRDERIPNTEIQFGSSFEEQQSIEEDWDFSSNLLDEFDLLASYQYDQLDHSNERNVCKVVFPNLCPKIEKIDNFLDPCIIPSAPTPDPDPDPDPVPVPAPAPAPALLPVPDSDSKMSDFHHQSSRFIIPVKKDTPPTQRIVSQVSPIISKSSNNITSTLEKSPEDIKWIRSIKKEVISPISSSLVTSEKLVFQEGMCSTRYIMADLKRQKAEARLAKYKKTSYCFTCPMPGCPNDKYNTATGLCHHAKTKHQETIRDAFNCGIGNCKKVLLTENGINAHRKKCAAKPQQNLKLKSKEKSTDTEKYEPINFNHTIKIEPIERVNIIDEMDLSSDSPIIPIGSMKQSNYSHTIKTEPIEIEIPNFRIKTEPIEIPYASIKTEPIERANFTIKTEPDWHTQRIKIEPAEQDSQSMNKPELALFRQITNSQLYKRLNEYVKNDSSWHNLPNVKIEPDENAYANKRPKMESNWPNQSVQIEKEELDSNIRVKIEQSNGQSDVNHTVKIESKEADISFRVKTDPDWDSYPSINIDLGENAQDIDSIIPSHLMKINPTKKNNENILTEPIWPWYNQIINFKPKESTNGIHNTTVEQIIKEPITKKQKCFNNHDNESVRISSNMNPSVHFCANQNFNSIPCSKSIKIALGDHTYANRYPPDLTPVQPPVFFASPQSHPSIASTQFAFVSQGNFPVLRRPQSSNRNKNNGTNRKNFPTTSSFRFVEGISVAHQ